MRLSRTRRASDVVTADGAPAGKWDAPLADGALLPGDSFAARPWMDQDNEFRGVVVYVVHDTRLPCWTISAVDVFATVKQWQLSSRQGRQAQESRVRAGMRFKSVDGD